VEVDGGGGLESHGGADLPDGGGVAVIGGEGEDIVVNLLLLGGKISHKKAPFKRGLSEVIV
jgi:hypothetical protein